MEPREAASLPIPRFRDLESAWALLAPQARRLDKSLRAAEWTNVVKSVDEALLVDTLGLPRAQVVELHDAARTLRSRRMGKGSS